MVDQPPDETPKPRGAGRLVILGGAVALLAGLAIAWFLTTAGQGEPTPPPASQGGLVIEAGEDDSRIDPAKPLRCFVAGQFVGELTLTECAQRNGVATDALDVGVDETGALAAAEQAGALLTPLPPAEAETPPDSRAEPPLAAAPEPTPLAEAAGCWRHERSQWRRLPGEIDLNSCVQTLFAGRCEKPGAASYGRWGQQTLRLVTGKVEISSDNRSFRTLASQPSNCSLPPVG